MTAIWILEAIGYAMLGAAVVVVNWHRKQTRVAAIVLLLYSLASSATFFLHPPLEWRIIREAVLVAGVATVMAILHLKGDGCRCYRIALVLCALDVAFCGALALHGTSDAVMKGMFGWAVNLTYIGLCACVSSLGIRDAYVAWIADIDRVRSMDSSAPELDWAIRALDR